MWLDIINKILMFLFFMSVLNTARHAYYFIQTWFTSTQEEPIKYKIGTKSLMLLGISLAYLLASIFTGIKI